MLFFELVGFTGISERSDESTAGYYIRTKLDPRDFLEKGLREAGRGTLRHDSGRSNKDYKEVWNPTKRYLIHPDSFSQDSGQCPHATPKCINLGASVCEAKST